MASWSVRENKAVDDPERAGCPPARRPSASPGSPSSWSRRCCAAGGAAPSCPNWGATLYGEVRGVGDFRGVLRGMMAGLWVTFAIAIVFLFLVEKTFGWQFFNAANMNYWGAVYGSKAAPTIPV